MPMVTSDACNIDERVQLANDSSSSRESNTNALPVVVLPDAEPRAFELVLSYIYTDCIVPVKQGQYLCCALCESAQFAECTAQFG